MKKFKSKKPKISYEPESDVLSWELTNKNIYSAKESGNIVVHSTKNETPVLIEILEASKFLSQANRLVGQNLPVRQRIRALAY